MRLLVSYKGIYDQRIAQAALDKEVLYPSYIYYKTNEDIRDQLINKLYLTDDSSEASSLMCCIAMQGDEKALEVLKYVEDNPRPWRSSLYVNPSIYAQEGGWTFDKEGKRHELIFSPCLQMEKGAPKEDEPILLTQIREDICPECGCKMMNILSIDGNHKNLSHLGLDGKIKATACPNCSLYNTYFNKYTLDGDSEVFYDKEKFFKSENYVTDEELENTKNNKYVLNPTPRPPLFATGSDDIHTIGGMGRWIQDFDFVDCPSCHKKMKLLAQMEWSTLLDNGDSTCYVEVCTECETLAIFHQNT